MLTISPFFLPTSSFCEADYAVTIYIAEFINAPSSLTYCRSSPLTYQRLHFVSSS